MAERLALLTLDHRVLDSNPPEGGILCRPKKRFIVLSQKFDQNFMKIFPGVKEIWSRHKLNAQTHDLQL